MKGRGRAFTGKHGGRRRQRRLIRCARAAGEHIGSPLPKYEMLCSQYENEISKTLLVAVVYVGGCYSGGAGCGSGMGWGATPRSSAGGYALGGIRAGVA